jgi:hypothetical protein
VIFKDSIKRPYKHEKIERNNMKATVLYGPRDVRFEEHDMPKIEKPTDAVIRISATCVCGSDLWPYRGLQPVNEPTPMGHEYCGIVEEVGAIAGQPIAVQPVSIAYTRIDGMPLGRRYRPLLAWYGGMAMAPHLWRVLGLGTVEVVVEFHPVTTYAECGSRKALAQLCYERVAGGVAAALAGRRQSRSGAARRQKRKPARGDIAAPAIG